MDVVGQLIGGVVEYIGTQINASSLRLGPVPALAVFVIVLVLLSLVARPSTRWTMRDLGHLAAVPRAMALAAEFGAAAAVSLGTAGVARASSAFDRLQTLAALPILAHVARTAARSGVPLRVSVNDPVAAHLAETTLNEAYLRTATTEREERSVVEYLGDGRPVAAADAMSGGGASAGFVVGGTSEEALLLMIGSVDAADWTSVGTASASQASSALLTGEGTLIGPELFQAPSDLQSTGHARTGVLAVNRLLAAALATLLIGSAVALASGLDVAGVLAGR